MSEAVNDYIKIIMEKKMDNQKRFFDILLNLNLDLFKINKIIFEKQVGTNIINIKIEYKDSDEKTVLFSFCNTPKEVYKKIESFIDNGIDCLDEIGFKTIQRESIVKEVKKILFFKINIRKHIITYEIDIAYFNDDIE